MLKPGFQSALLSILGLLTFALRWGVESLDFGYHDNHALEDFLRTITKTYPSITHLYSIGESVNKTDLWVLAIGQSPRDHVLLRPNFKFVGGIHGNEAVGREELLHMLEYLVTRYGTDSEVSHLLNTTTIHILPSMNPDGFAASVNPDCQGIHGRSNANGYDLNRNFPDFFRPNPDPIQPETQAIIDWVHSVQFVLSVGLHGGALVASYPFDNYMEDEHVDEARESLSPDDDLLVHLALTYTIAHPAMRNTKQCGKYEFEEGISNGADWYPLTGGMQDYNYLQAGCVEITIELSCCKYPQANRLRSHWEADRRPMLDLMKQVHMGVKGIVMDQQKRPIEGAIVTVQGREMVKSRTTNEGEYWKLLLPGRYRLLVSLNGCYPQIIPFRVGNGTVARLDVILHTMTHEDLSSSTPPVFLSGILFHGLSILLMLNLWFTVESVPIVS